jgi:large subunit ribosomal protein L24
MTLHVKKGDTVLVIAGKDKGKSGKVLTAIPADNAVIVSDVNIVSKHKKPRSAQDKGGIIKRENKIDSSNVQIICPECGKATRVAHAVDENGKKFRQCKKCKASLDKAVSVKKEAKKAAKKVESKDTKPAKEVKAAKTTKTTAKKAETKKVSGVTKSVTKTTAKKTQSKGQ